ncbi:MAG: hypothetical protein H0U03_04850 [Actinobacteria bacterium]|nr:hypothetical protein [Actinomycetota bacterium]
MKTDWKRRWSGWAGVGGVMLTLVAASAASSAAAPAPPPGIKVRPSPLAPGTRVPPNGVTFRTLSCNVDARGFHAVGRAGSWKLLIEIRPFSGYHRYEIEYGDVGPVDFDVFGPSNPPGYGFSNGQEPPTDQRRLTAGGGLAFVGRRSLVSLSFAITYDGRWPRPGVVRVLGVALCRYPGRRR